MSKLSPAEEVTLKTYNKVAEVWVSQHHDVDFWQSEMDRFQKYLINGKILDVGAGGARDAVGLIARGYDYTGIDISDNLLKIAQKELPGQKFYRQSLYELTFQEKFDGFWCSAVLLHIPKARIDEALQRIKSVVRPGGVGFISLKDGQGERVETELWENGGHFKRLFSYWSQKDFESELHHNRYSMIDYVYRTDSPKTKWHCFYVRSKK